MSKVFKNTTVPDRKGEPIKILKPDEAEPEDLTLKQILWLILNTIEFKVNNDSIQAGRLADAIDRAKDGETIEIEEGIHDWLTLKLDEKNRLGYEVCAFLFRINGDAVRKHICEGFEKTHQSKEREITEIPESGIKDC